MGFRGSKYLLRRYDWSPRASLPFSNPDRLAGPSGIRGATRRQPARAGLPVRPSCGEVRRSSTFRRGRTSAPEPRARRPVPPVRFVTSAKAGAERPSRLHGGVEHSAGRSTVSRWRGRRENHGAIGRSMGSRQRVLRAPERGEMDDVRFDDFSFYAAEREASPLEQTIPANFS